MPRSKRKLEPEQLPFPYFQYASVLGTYSVLVCFAAVALPPSSKWLGFQPIPQATSIDRPQYQFLNPITANPAGTVMAMSVGLFAVNMWWAGWMRLWWAQEKHLVRIQNNTQRAQEKIFGMRSAAILTVAGVCVYYVLLILFGAPLLSHKSTTISLSLLLSVLTVYTPSYTIPLPKLNIPYVDEQTYVNKNKNASMDSVVRRYVWVTLFSRRKVETPVERAIVYPVFGTICGCWLGVIPLALDWDRPWQAWPLLPAYGALVGHLLGSVCALYVSGWKHIVELGRRAKID